MFEHYAPERYGRYKSNESSNDHQPEDLISGFFHAICWCTYHCHGLKLCVCNQKLDNRFLAVERR